MSKQGGMGDNLYISGYDISGDINSLNRISGGPRALDTTDITQSAHERLGGLRDGGLEFVSYFNKATDRAHPVLKALPTTDIYAMYCRGTVLGAPSAAMVAKQINYDGSRSNDGSFQFKVSAQPNGYGLEWGKLMTAGKRTDVAATNGTSVDFGTGTTNFGLQAWLHVFAFTGTSVTVKLQSSSDNGVGDAFADVTGGAFTAATAVGAQRIETTRALAIERYLRVVTTGTFSNAIFAVMVARNDTAVSF